MDWEFHETRMCPKCEVEYDAYSTGQHLPFVLQIRGGPMPKNWKSDLQNFPTALGLFGTIETSACPSCVPDQKFLRECPEHAPAIVPLVRPMR